MLATAVIFPIFYLPLIYGFVVGLLPRQKVTAIFFGGCAAAVTLVALFLLVEAAGNNRRILSSFRPELIPAFAFWLPFTVPFGVLGGYGAYRYRLNHHLSLRQSLVSGTIVFVFGLLLTAMSVPAMYCSRERSPRSDCASNLRQIGLAMAMYADNYRQQLPERNGVAGLNQLAGVVSSRSIFHCPADKLHRPASASSTHTTSLRLSEETVSYAYRGGLTWQGPEEEPPPVCWDKLPAHENHKMNVLFTDGHVEALTITQFQVLTNRTAR